MHHTVKNIDMLTGSLYKNILLFTIPIALSSMFQQLFNAADTAIVGFFDTAASLAAVGTNGEIIALIVSLSSGLSVGVNVLIAGQLGQKKTKHICPIIRTSLLLAVIVGMIGLAAGQLLASPLLMLIKTPADILKASTLYLRIYFLSYPFLMLYDFGSAILRAYGNSRFPFIALTLSGIVNVLLNVIFVVLFHLGVCGVATATVLSTGFSAMLVLLRLKRDTDTLDPSPDQAKFDSRFVMPVFRIGIPSALQGAVFCFANIFVQASVNHFGSDAIAGSTIAMNFEYFTYYVITAFGQTATTFASQNYAAGQTGRCKKITRICLLLSVVSSLIVIEPLVIFREFCAGIFSTDHAVIQYACQRILCILFYEPLCSFYEIPAGILRGTGHSFYPAAATILGTCCLRIVWICTVFKKHPALDILYMAFPLSWIVTILLMVTGFVILHRLTPSLS